MNRFKALLLLAKRTGLVVWAGQLVGGTGGMVVALAFAGVMNLASEPHADPAVARRERPGGTVMKCPKCGTLLNEVAKAGVLIDVCDHCLGIWLERGELEKITARD